MDKYKCEICGKNHDIFVSLSVPLPRMISSMSESDRELRVRKKDEFYYVDEDLMFANGWVNVGVENYDYPFFYWKTWVSISKSKFSNSINVLATGEIVEFPGKMEEELPFYPGSYGLDTKTLLQVTKDGLVVEIKATGTSKLKEDQTSPISEKRVIEIMQMLHHNPKTEERRKNLIIPFSERLNQAIKFCEEEYLKKNKDFVIDISSNEVLFQIVSSAMLEIKGGGKGFGIDLSFDDSFEETKKQVERFNLQEYSKEFKLHNIDGIPTYQLDLGNDEIKLEQLVIKIIKDVYMENLKTTEVDHLEI